MSASCSSALVSVSWYPIPLTSSSLVQISYLCIDQVIIINPQIVSIRRPNQCSVYLSIHKHITAFGAQASYITNHSKNNTIYQISCRFQFLRQEYALDCNYLSLTHQPIQADSRFITVIEIPPNPPLSLIYTPESSRYASSSHLIIAVPFQWWLPIRTSRHQRIPQSILVRLSPREPQRRIAQSVCGQTRSSRVPEACLELTFIRNLAQTLELGGSQMNLKEIRRISSSS